jgi:ABC-type nitrate/sulfonate/bicarbonate transport system permease component
MTVVVGAALVTSLVAVVVGAAVTVVVGISYHRLMNWSVAAAKLVTPSCTISTP